jgi:arylsulfatase A-like enzyme
MKYAYTDRVLNLLEEHDLNKRFFIVFSPQNPHSPLQVPEKYTKKYSLIDDENRRKYLGLVSMMDEAIGQIVQKLDDLNYLDETLIAFTSDNGGSAFESG